MKLSLFSLQSIKCCIFNVETVTFYFIECSWFGKYQQKESHPHAHTHTLTQEEVKGILCVLGPIWGRVLHPIMVVSLPLTPGQILNVQEVKTNLGKR